VRPLGFQQDLFVVKQRVFALPFTFIAAVVLVFCCASKADPLDQWGLRAQFGVFTGDNLFSVVQGRGTTVAVGTYPGMIFCWTNIGNWNYVTNGLNFEYFYGVAFDSKQFVAVGSGAAPLIMVSSNGLKWNTVYTGSGFGPGDTFRAVACASDASVAVGTGGRIVVSTNHLTWTSVASGTTNDLRAIVYANGVFAVGDSKGGVLLSTNGFAWTRQPTATTGVINGIAYGNNMFVAVGGTGRRMDLPRHPPTVSTGRCN
jgi:hypothetical protein